MSGTGRPHVPSTPHTSQTPVSEPAETSRCGICNETIKPIAGGIAGCTSMYCSIKWCVKCYINILVKNNGNIKCPVCDYGTGGAKLPDQVLEKSIAALRAITKES